MIAKRVIFSGRVQGVGFRYTTKDLARGFDVCGWVKNLPEGTVELQVMGEEDEVKSFIKEIAEESGITHSAVSQLRSEAVRLLRDGLETHYSDSAAEYTPTSRIAASSRSAYLARVAEHAMATSVRDRGVVHTEAAAS